MHRLKMLLGKTRGRLRCLVLAALAVGSAAPARAQTLTQRGFVESRGTWFPEDALNDTVNTILDVHARGEVFLRPWDFLRVAGGVEVLGNTHDQVDSDWSLDVADRGVRRPPLSLRRLSATLSRGRFTLDAGKQFIRWGKADILTPTDRFAPRDYLNVIDPELLAVRGARATLAFGANTLDAVVVPIFTPSRIPLLDQRWGPTSPVVTLVDVTGPDAFPKGTQTGLRWSRTDGGWEYAVAWYEGFNHLPNLQPVVQVKFVPSAPGAENALPTTSVSPAAAPVAAPLVSVPIVRSYPAIRMYGGDLAALTRWLTLKGEVGYFASPAADTDEYALYVVQAERQHGEWMFVGGYAGLAVAVRRSLGGFAPDRGVAESFIGRASYTIDSNSTAAVESVVRQNGDGLYLKGEYSRASGQHLRVTLAGVVIRGAIDDFLGQYRLNSNLSVTLRYSF